MMRHALAPQAIAARPLGMHQTPAQAALVTASCFALRLGSCCLCASAGAIPLTAVALRTDVDDDAASSAQKTTDGLWHRRSTNNRRAIDKRTRCVLTYRRIVLVTVWYGHGIGTNFHVFTDVVPGSLR